MVYPIITKEHPTLRKVAEKFDAASIESAETQKLIDDMIETMYSANGVGLAAPQINISKQIIIAESEEKKPIALINPEIISKSWRTTLSEEGCLSVPGVFGIVRRHRGVKVRAYDRFGKSITLKTNGFLAIILQHEIDHLNGILFVDKAEKVQQIENKVGTKI